MLTYIQLTENLQKGERLLTKVTQYKHDIELIEFHLQELEYHFDSSPYNNTLTTLLKWLNYFIIEIEYEEGVLIHHVHHLQRTINRHSGSMI